MILEGQTIWDIAIQYNGTIEGVINYLPQLDNIDIAIPTGSVIETPNYSNNVSLYFAKNNVSVASLGVEEIGVVNSVVSSPIVQRVNDVVLEGQTIWDITTQYGDIEQVGIFLTQFNDINNPLTVGNNIVKGVSTRYSRYFVNYSIDVATLGEEIESGQFAFDYILDFIIN